MRKRLKILVPALLVAVVLVSVGAGLVRAQTTQPTTPLSVHDLFIGKLAEKLGIGVEQLTSAITGARTDTVNQLATEGRITAAQKDRMLERAEQGQGAFGFRGGMMGGGRGMWGGAGNGYGPENCPMWGGTQTPAP